LRFVTDWTSSLILGRLLVLGLHAASSPIVGAKQSQGNNEGAHDESGSELKK